MTESVAVVGLGRVGLPLALSFADRGLEWTYRIAQEPRRLLPRYLYYNPRFLAAIGRQLLRERTAHS